MSVDILCNKNMKENIVTALVTIPHTIKTEQISSGSRKPSVTHQVRRGSRGGNMKMCHVNDMPTQDLNFREKKNWDLREERRVSGRECGLVGWEGHVDVYKSDLVSDHTFGNIYGDGV